MATQASVLAWRIPWTEEHVRLVSWGCKESDMTEAAEHTCTHFILVIEYHSAKKTKGRDSYLISNRLYVNF